MQVQVWTKRKYIVFHLPKQLSMCVWSWKLLTNGTIILNYCRRIHFVCFLFWMKPQQPFYMNKHLLAMLACFVKTMTNIYRYRMYQKTGTVVILQSTHLGKNKRKLHTRKRCRPNNNTCFINIDHDHWS